MFNSRPTIQSVPLFDEHECLVVDDALQDPLRWRAWAVEQRQHFAQRPYAYPGIELDVPADALAAVSEHFGAHFRQRLGGRRTLGAAARFSLATWPPHALEPRQWSFHCDSQSVAPGQCIAASVLYLFDDDALGGTSFYRPRRSAEDVARLVQDSCTLPRDTFSARYPDIASGYMTNSNAWFERIASVPARGRLTLNGFFGCRRSAA